jgi:hypothetical protein
MENEGDAEMVRLRQGLGREKKTGRGEVGRLRGIEGGLEWGETSQGRLFIMGGFRATELGVTL